MQKDESLQESTKKNEKTEEYWLLDYNREIEKIISQEITNEGNSFIFTLRKR